MPQTKRDAAVTQKYRCSCTFKRNKFRGDTSNIGYIIANKPKDGLSRKRHHLTKSRNSNLKPAVKKRKLGGLSKAHLKLYGLEQKSHLVEWLKSFIPFTLANNKYNADLADVKGDKKTKFAFLDWTAYSNVKGMLVNTGTAGCIYGGKHEQFTNESIMRQMGAMIMDGLVHSPEVMRKMKPQSANQTYRNNFNASLMGSNYHQAHKSFRAFFTYQEPLSQAEDSKLCPNYKV